VRNVLVCSVPRALTSYPCFGTRFLEADNRSQGNDAQPGGLDAGNFIFEKEIERPFEFGCLPGIYLAPVRSDSLVRRHNGTPLFASVDSFQEAPGAEGQAELLTAGVAHEA